MQENDWIYVIIGVLFFPYFVWLSVLYVKATGDDADFNSKRMQSYFVFLLILQLLNLSNKVFFKFEAGFMLIVAILIFLFFSFHMLVSILKDRKLVD